MNAKNSSNPLTPASTKIVLAGESFRWSELPRRQAREAGARIAEIDALLSEAADGEKPGVGQFWKACNLIIDFFADFHPRMAVMKTKIEAVAEEDQILLAYREVQRVILTPLMTAMSRIPSALESSGASSTESGGESGENPETP